VRIIGSIPITPGGIGIIELGLTGALVGFGGKNAAVVAAVLVYRFLTTVPTLILGLAAAFTWRRQGRKEPAGVVSSVRDDAAVLGGSETDSGTTPKGATWTVKKASD
jgi:hypothetical protein